MVIQHAKKIKIKGLLVTVTEQDQFEQDLYILHLIKKHGKIFKKTFRISVININEIAFRDT